ncbi:unnamed protein product [Caenorhabditis angaria]|uniref:F-box domain-containing protein n=1 Tax=Caenorhabditis angaria TaxID=860376 RepID=A0A9P1IGV4_9PELO|nr:unnamed protein product [Caenorhabditis angaria]
MCETDDRRGDKDDWHKLPKVIRQKVFGYLDPVSKLNLSLCSRRTWNTIVEKPDFFHKIVVTQDDMRYNESYDVHFFYEDTDSELDDCQIAGDYYVTFSDLPRRRHVSDSDDDDHRENSDDDMENVEEENEERHSEGDVEMNEEENEDEEEEFEDEEKEEESDDEDEIEEVKDENEEKKQQDELWKRRRNTVLTRVHHVSDFNKKMIMVEGRPLEVVWKFIKKFLEKRQKSVGVIEIRAEIIRDVHKLKTIPKTIKKLSLICEFFGLINENTKFLNVFPQILDAKVRLKLGWITAEHINDFIKLWKSGKIADSKLEICVFHDPSNVSLDTILTDLDSVQLGAHNTCGRFRSTFDETRQIFRTMSDVNPNNHMDIIKSKNQLVLLINNEIKEDRGAETNRGSENHICNTETIMEEELANYKLQLQQVEAALLGDPENDELLKLKADLQEIIELQEEITAKDTDEIEDVVIAPKVIHKWTVGERVFAPHPDGKKVYARIDSLTPAGVAITFTKSGQKTIVDPSDLELPPENQRKTYAFDNPKSNAASSSGHGKKEWQAEKERRKQRALKKEQKKKELDKVKDNEKKSWQKFNLKANAKGLKGLKRVNATGSSQDGSSAYGVKRETTVSSRNQQFQFKATRGAMDSLF